MERAKEGDEALSDDIRSASLDSTLVKELVKIGELLGPALAVRSSAIEEDGEWSSWAGQLETVVGVRPGKMLEAAVLTCWASAFGHRASAYKQSGRASGFVRMAVLIQPMVEPRCAGVMFTVNPLTGSWREITVEAAWGQAGPVVQGEVVPDAYVVRRPRRVPRPVRRVLERVRLDVVEDHIRPQRLKTVVSDAGTRLTAVKASRVDAPKLRHSELLRLCRLGLRIESFLAQPQDIEWALGEDGRFVVLQSRPVTTNLDVRRTGPALWTRQFIGERWTEPATPLGWSLMSGLMEQFIQYPDTQRRLLGGGSPTRLYRFSPYMNVTIFRHLAFKVPGAPPPRFMMELLPPDEKKGWMRRRAQAPDFRVYGSIVRETWVDRRWRRFAANPWTNPGRWVAYRNQLIQRLPELEKPGMDLHACLALSDRCREMAEKYIGIHICSLLWANLMYQLCEGALRAEGKADLVHDLLRPIEESCTVRTNRALWLLGRGELEPSEFLQNFGHRAASSWELFSPRWRESPAQVEVLAAAAAQHGDPALLAHAQAARAKGALESLSGPMRKLGKLTQTYLLLRENQRFHFDRLLWAWKVQLLAIEQHLGMQVRFLTNAELESHVGGTSSQTDVEALIVARKREWDAEVGRRRQGDEPPNFLMGSAVIDATPNALRLQGTGTSPGVVTGVVRLVRTPAEGVKLQPGDILVTRATDPGWTPLFLKAGGLIVEMGGMLSHGAVVAREYGLPAVANVAGATTNLSDGQVVTLDGRLGAVWVQ